MKEKEFMFYKTPQMEVVNIELEQAVLSTSDPNAGIPDLEEDTWS